MQMKSGIFNRHLYHSVNIQNGMHVTLFLPDIAAELSEQTVRLF